MWCPDAVCSSALAQGSWAERTWVQPMVCSAFQRVRTRRIATQHKRSVRPSTAQGAGFGVRAPAKTLHLRAGGGGIGHGGCLPI
jgi:hypothetical protein